MSKAYRNKTEFGKCAECGKYMYRVVRVYDNGDVEEQIICVGQPTSLIGWYKVMPYAMTLREIAEAEANVLHCCTVVSRLTGIRVKA